MRKYGWDNFELEIIELCSLEELKEKEIYWIAYYDTYYHGYNETKGEDYVGEKSIHYGEDHPKHILTKEDVI